MSNFISTYHPGIPKKSKGNGRFFQPKLTINAPNDPYEVEADAMADHVMSMESPSIQRKQGEELFFKAHTPSISHIQRKCAACEEEEKKMERKETSGAKAGTTGDFQNYVGSLNNSGQPLSKEARNFFEPRFGHDFSQVKVHTDSIAAKSAQSINALAYTSGNNIVFNQGGYSPGSEGGKKLLGHELTHVVQQGATNGNSIQRTCFDGVCADCAGGMRTIWITVFFRRRATVSTMRVLREKINEAKSILRNCCINLLFEFNWTLLRGARDFDPGVARPAGDALGAWDFPADAETLGEGTTFAGARGIPMLVVDNVPRTGGGVTISSAFDTEYTGAPYIVLPIEHGRTRSIAHELGHVIGILSHGAGPDVMDTAGNTNVTEDYCNRARGIAT